jgi:hypothetical protein
MDSLRAATQKAGLDQPFLSVRDLAGKFGLPEPISVRRVIQELAPEQIVFETGSAEAGDVSGWARLGVLSTGWWSLKGKLHDSGFWYGDNYVLGLAFKHVDPSGFTFGVKQEGHLDAGEDDSFQQNGREPWIEANWEAIKSEGFSWHLHADPSLGSDEILPFVLKALGFGLAAGITILWLGAESEGNCWWEEGPQGERIRRCEV